MPLVLQGVLKPVLNASNQVDLFQEDIPNAWKLGLSLLPINEGIRVDNHKFRLMAANYIHWLQQGAESREDERFGAVPGLINQACEKMNQWVYETAKFYLAKNKSVALLGGDHSTPLGLLRVMAENHPEFGILQVDAHADLRPAYENFEYSHASIAYNFIKIPQVKSLVQVGIRDFCEQEWQLAQEDQRISLFTAEQIHTSLFNHGSWDLICINIISTLPKKVYLSIDIDGLEPQLCPHTGTPVPGGLSYAQLVYLIKKVVQSGREIIGFDIVEVAPGPATDEWDANVGARLLYRVANLTAVSQGKLGWARGVK
jgi:agmatinase